MEVVVLIQSYVTTVIMISMAPTTTTTVPPAARSSRPLAVAGHVRSASVPCHTHPLLADVDDQVLALRSWTSNPGPKYPLSLAHVRALLCVLDDLLRLPLAQAALPHRSAGGTTDSDTDGLVDGFLVLADAFGTFLSALVSLLQHAAELRAAVRRRDGAKLASAARAQRQAGREPEQLASAVAREAARCTCARPAAAATGAEAEVARAVAEAVNDTAAAAAAVFLEVGAVADAAAALASPGSASPKKSRLPPLSRSKQQRTVVGDGEDRREGAALEKLHELEQCVTELESESEKVFRSLVQTRVSLLNIHTPTF